MLLENNVADVADVMPTLIFRLSEPTNILVLTQILHITYTCTLRSISINNLKVKKKCVVKSFY